MGPKDISEALDKPYGAVRVLLRRMTDAGLLTQEGYGKYVVARGPVRYASPPPSQWDYSNSSNSSNTSTSGRGVTGVSGVTPPTEDDQPSLSADGDEWVQARIDEGATEEAAVKAWMDRMQQERR
jgi:hypothetical protein